MTRKNAAGVLMSVFTMTTTLLGSSAVVYATDPTSASGSTKFDVEVHEVLGVSITVPKEWASGNTGDFLRNAIGLKVYSNNGAGFTASMKTKTATTALTNKKATDYTIDTLSMNTAKNAISSSKWGYSLGSYAKANSTGTDETDAGEDTSTYKPMSSSATTVLYSATAASDEQDIYFGAKADMTKASGTYSNTVVISVVSGVVTDPDNPVDPQDPVDPTPVDPTDNPSYDGDHDRTVYTEVADNGTTTTTNTEITSGDARDSYQDPAGVTTSTSSDINEGTPLATGLAVTASIAAATGIFFFILAKRRKDDDEEEDAV